MRLGKVLSGVVWHGGLGSVSVRQSCLGTVSRGAVKFGEARSGSHGNAGLGRSGRGEALRGQSGRGSLGLPRSVLERRRGVSSGSHGLLRLVMASLVKTRLGKAVKVLRGMSRLCDVRLGRARQSRRVAVCRGESWNGGSCQGSHV